MRRLRALLVAEDGNYLAQNIIGSILSLIVLGGIMSAMAGMMAFQAALEHRTKSSNELAATATMFRADVLWAARLAPVDARTLDIIVATKDGGCKEVRWEVTGSGTGTKLVSTSRSYPGFAAGTGPAACTGTASAPLVKNALDAPSADTAFSYTNSGGRTIAFAESTPALGSDPKPAGVTDAIWGSTAAAGVALTTALKVADSTPATHRISQAALHLDPVVAVADAPTYAVPLGNIKE